MAEYEAQRPLVVLWGPPDVVYRQPLILWAMTVLQGAAFVLLTLGAWHGL